MHQKTEAPFESESGLGGAFLFEAGRNDKIRKGECKIDNRRKPQKFIMI